jgi:hypothetical protein
LPFDGKIEMARLGAPSADLSVNSISTDISSMVAVKIADEAVRPDPDTTTELRCVEQLETDVENFVEDAAVGYCDVDGYPWCEGPLG